MVLNLKSIVFEGLPEHDTCWSLISGVDGKLYIGVCGEMTGGMSAYVASYDPAADRIEYLIEMASALGVPADNGQGAHSKVHYCLMQDNDGTLYAATHATGAPLGDWIWRPWNCWTHPQKQFSGSGIAAFHPDGELIFTEIFLPNEGSRCMALAPARKKIYGISYPRNHFFIYDLKKREVRDLGRIGSINPQCIFTDREENAYTTDDFGKILKCHADTEELSDTGVQIPHAGFRNGYHNTLYDVTPAPDGGSVYGVTWAWGERLFRYDFKENRLHDYGKACGEENGEWDHIIHSHAGGVVFGPDGLLYFVANVKSGDKSVPHLIRMNPATEKRENLGVIRYRGAPADHISRAVTDAAGNLYFAETGNTPTKLFRYTPETAGEMKIKARRLWG
ncbi:MAG: hypothetical protein PHH77_12135 [Victivallaceae bacterium]|nr:hypothetical protein [Victivallaceae bacterium]